MADHHLDEALLNVEELRQGWPCSAWRWRRSRSRASAGCGRRHRPRVGARCKPHIPTRSSRASRAKRWFPSVDAEQGEGSTSSNASIFTSVLTATTAASRRWIAVVAPRSVRLCHPWHCRRPQKQRWGMPRAGPGQQRRRTTSPGQIRPRTPPKTAQDPGGRERHWWPRAENAFRASSSQPVSYRAAIGSVFRTSRPTGATRQMAGTRQSGAGGRALDRPLQGAARHPGFPRALPPLWGCSGERITWYRGSWLNGLFSKSTARSYPPEVACA